MIHRETYFDAVRETLFGGSLSQQQVDGQNVLISVWETQDSMSDARWFAYMLATTYHECDKKMWPIEEYGKGKGHPYGVKDSETGQTYYARGFVGLTWRENYAKASKALGLVEDRQLEWHPALALDSMIASQVLFRGMDEGWFTGKRLSQYFNAERDDPVNARQIVNGNDKDTLIASYHEAFLAAIIEATADEDEEEILFETDLEIKVQGEVTSIQVNGVEWIPPGE